VSARRPRLLTRTPVCSKLRAIGRYILGDAGSFPFNLGREAGLCKISHQVSAAGRDRRARKRFSSFSG